MAIIKSIKGRDAHGALEYVLRERIKDYAERARAEREQELATQTRDDLREGDIELAGRDPPAKSKKPSQGRDIRDLKGEVEVLATNMAGKNLKELATEFTALARLQPEREVNVQHRTISTRAEDKVTPDTQRRLVERLVELDAPNTIYIAVRHKHHDHDEVHLLESRVRYDGTVKSDSQDYRRNEELAQQLAREFGLTEVKPSSETMRRSLSRGEMQRFERTGEISTRVRLQERVDRAIGDGATAAELVERLAELRVEMMPFVNPDGRITGVSFRLDGKIMRGTDLGRGYTWAGLQREWKDQEHRRGTMTYEHQRDYAELSRDRAAERDERAAAARDGRDVALAERDAEIDERSDREVELATRSDRSEFAEPGGTGGGVERVAGGDAAPTHDDGSARGVGELTSGADDRHDRGAARPADNWRRGGGEDLGDARHAAGGASEPDREQSHAGGDSRGRTAGAIAGSALDLRSADDEDARPPHRSAPDRGTEPAAFGQFQELGGVIDHADDRIADRDGAADVRDVVVRRHADGDADRAERADRPRHTDRSAAGLVADARDHADEGERAAAVMPGALAALLEQAVRPTAERERRELDEAREHDADRAKELEEDRRRAATLEVVEEALRIDPDRFGRDGVRTVLELCFVERLTATIKQALEERGLALPDAGQLRDVLNERIEQRAEEVEQERARVAELMARTCETEMPAEGVRVEPERERPGEQSKREEHGFVR